MQKETLPIALNAKLGKTINLYL